MHTNSKLLFDKYATAIIQGGMRILEIGPDEFPSTYERSVDDPSIVWHYLDIHGNPNLTYPNCKEYSFPIPDKSYDIVLSGQVIEHVKKPWEWILELARVTRVEGFVIIINPVSWIYHEAPVDCWRIYPDGMKALYETAGLSILMSIWESLETPFYKRFIPGISIENQTRKRQFMYRILGRLGFPVERSYDTITIGIKHADTNYTGQTKGRIKK
jgi:SAM-dependent methyltransferase